MPLTAAQIKQLLQTKKRQTYQRIKNKHPRAHRLLLDNSLLLGSNLRLHAAKLIATATMATTMATHSHLLAVVPTQLSLTPLASLLAQRQLNQTELGTQKELIALLQPLRAQKPGTLNSKQVDAINAHLQYAFSISSAAELDGYKLNHQYGWIGYEQHLKRYPGDTISQHDEMQSAGMAPGLGAWGYFAASKQSLTHTDVLREKYYIAVQTLYIPEWNTSQPHIKEWFHHRKVIVINPENGQAVVAVIGDAGPAKWTGKQFGGSPEVMQHLNLHNGPRKGKVVVLFVDDPENNIQLGPLNYNQPIYV